MVGLYKRRKPLYNVKAYIYKQRTNANGSMLYYEPKASNVFYCKDNGFETIRTSNGGITESVTTGQLETYDLHDGDILPDDKVMYCGELYIVVKVKFEDDDAAKMLSKRANGKTTVDLRK